MKIKDYTILIVEDEFIATEYLSQILHSFDIDTIFKASSSDEALDIVKNNHIDLVFMDINIQGAIDGIRCASLLNNEYFLPIIFTTAYADTNTINEANEENIFGYLVKPFQASNVEATLNVAISNLKRLEKLTNLNSHTKDLNKSLDLANGYIYSLETKTLSLKNTPINLTKKELEVFDILCRNINNNISYAYIKELVWSDKDITDSTIRDVISRIKKKIPHIDIENISNYGYILKSNVS